MEDKESPSKNTEADALTEGLKKAFGALTLGLDNEEGRLHAFAVRAALDEFRPTLEQLETIQANIIAAAYVAQELLVDIGLRICAPAEIIKTKITQNTSDDKITKLNNVFGVFAMRAENEEARITTCIIRYCLEGINPTPHQLKTIMANLAVAGYVTQEKYEDLSQEEDLKRSKISCS